MQNQITFIDLFAGIGGIRLAFEQAGCKCVFSSEIDKQARKVYQDNFDDLPHGDITKVETDQIPEFDILTAGFPCQSFSIAGVTAYNAYNKEHGLKDQTKGAMFFEIVRILAAKKPAAFFLENVKHLVHHNNGKTFKTIMNILENDLKYHTYWKIIDSSPVVPQSRKRVYIVGFSKSLKFSFPEISGCNPTLGAIMDPNPPERYTLSDKTWNCIQKYSEKHKKKGNRFHHRIVTPNDISPTLTAHYSKSGTEILVAQKNKNPRRFTPKECKRLMGFPETFQINTTDSHAWRLLGNSVVVPIVTQIAQAITQTLKCQPPAKPKPYQPRLPITP